MFQPFRKGIDWMKDPTNKYLDIIIPHDHGHGTQNLLSHMPSEQEFSITSDIFAQLSDCTRLRILWLLCHAEECVSDIAAAIQMSSPAVSHHLRFLKQSGLIISRREGKEVLYTIADTKEAALVHRMIDEVFKIKFPKCPD